MKNSWTTTKLIALGALSVLNVLLHWVFYNSALVSSGSALSGIIALIISPFFITLTILVIGQFPAATLFLLIVFILDLPSPKIFPATLNLALVFVCGVLIDIIYSRLKSRQVLTAFLSGAIYNLVNGSAGIALFFTVGLTSSKTLPKFLTTLPGLVTTELIMIVIGGLIGILGLKAYTRISLTSTIKRIQGFNNV